MTRTVKSADGRFFRKRFTPFQQGGTFIRGAFTTRTRTTVEHLYKFAFNSPDIRHLHIVARFVLLANVLENRNAPLSPFFDFQKVCLGTDGHRIRDRSGRKRSAPHENSGRVFFRRNHGATGKRCVAPPFPRSPAVTATGTAQCVSWGRRFRSRAAAASTRIRSSVAFMAGLRLNHFASRDSEPGVRKATEKYAS